MAGMLVVTWKTGLKRFAKIACGRKFNLCFRLESLTSCQESLSLFTPHQTRTKICRRDCVLQIQVSIFLVATACKFWILLVTCRSGRCGVGAVRLTISPRLEEVFANARWIGNGRVPIQLQELSRLRMQRSRDPEILKQKHHNISAIDGIWCWVWGACSSDVSQFLAGVQPQTNPGVHSQGYQKSRWD